VQTINLEDWRREILLQDELFMKIYTFLPKDMIFSTRTSGGRL